MNSVLQQLFMMPAFRKGILECPKATDDSLKLLQFMKTIFTNLKNNKGEAYNASQLCKLITDFDGQHLSPYEQRDADEFFNLLVDRLEDDLRVVNCQNLIKDTFGGTFSNEFVCKECGNISSVKEEFIALNLQIHNKKSVTESLSAFVTSEQLTGNNAYHCDRCSRKVEAEKFISLGILPNVLIIALKRFEYSIQMKYSQSLTLVV